MKEVTPISTRKSDHIRINLEQDVQSGLTNGLERYHFVHRALPEVNFRDVEASVTIYNKTLSAPILISSMTGGTQEAYRINQVLAQAAQKKHIAMGVGSQRIALEQPLLESTFQVRKFAPDILLFANLGAIQLNYGYGIDECRRAVDMIEADALVLHLNPLQEALQKDGQTDFEGLALQIEAICKLLSVPVVVKEVGWGFTQRDIQLLHEAGVSAIDVAGAGGTSWSQVEMHRADDENQRKLAAAFINWGIPTAEAIENVIRVAPDMKIIASGGLKDGVDIAKCIAMGASLGGMAGPFLKAATQSLEDTFNLVDLITAEIKTCMFATGSPDISSLQKGKLARD